jgi:predicted short-subunit dehydrogenase-like oxidoreductase (DUF2520 family)
MNATKTNSYSYLIIGSGRVARHLSHYFHLLNLNFESWDRHQDPHALARKISSATHILLALSDHAIEGFYRQHLAGHEKTCVHFSGALDLDDIVCAHPLMTFAEQLYSLEQYRNIHFTLTGCDDLNQALPGLPNSYSLLAAEQKALYHSLCVVGGNFTTLLGIEMLKGLRDLNIPDHAIQSYLQQIVLNIFNEPGKAATGPLARKDATTVTANLRALEGSALQEIYLSFLKTYWPEYSRK